jgi:glycosidase
MKVKNRSLYEINTRVWLRNFDIEGKKALLSDVPLTYWEQFVNWGIENIWLMGVWETPYSTIRNYCLEPFLLDNYKAALKDFTALDVIGSPYSIEDYRISPMVGTKDDLLKLKAHLNSLGINLILDFVSNHFSADSTLVKTDPEIFLTANHEIFIEDPYTFFTAGDNYEKYFAHGRDPFYPAWRDTVQVNYFSDEARSFMINRLNQVAELCDGVRVDMAMLSLNNVFRNTWGRVLTKGNFSDPETEFWKEAIDSVKSKKQSFIFIAEAYWDLEWQLQKLGFDYTYDKRLMDRLKGTFVPSIIEHLEAEEDYQIKSVRFIENHDEPRAAHYLGIDKSKAAAILISTLMGMRFYFDGQFNGEKVRLPVQLGRKPLEKPNESLRLFYEKLLNIAKSEIFKYGDWQILRTKPSWETDPTFKNIISYIWNYNNQYRLVVINYSEKVSSARINFDTPQGMREIMLTDLLNNKKYARNSVEIRNEGLYVQLGPFQSHIFAF